MGIWGKKPEPSPDDELLDEFAAWYRQAQADDVIPRDKLSAKGSRERLRVVFGRAREVGGDLTDPTPDLIRAVLRDSDEVGDEAEAIMNYMLFLRANGRWRRSERNVQLCFDAFDELADDMGDGRTSFGPMIDDALAKVVAAQGVSDEVQAHAAGSLRFCSAIGDVLDRVMLRMPGDEAAAAEALGLDAGSRVAAHWRAALVESGLLMDVADGIVVPGRQGAGWRDATPVARVRTLESVLSTMLERTALELSEPEVDETGGAAASFGMGLVVALASEHLGEIPLDQVIALSSESDDELPEGRGDEVARLVRAAFADLVTIGLLREEDGVFGVDAEILPLVAASATSAIGWWPEGDREPWWAPVEQRSGLGDEAWLDVVLVVDGVERTWRRVVVPADRSLASLHTIIQAVHGWWDSGLHLVQTDGGQYTAPWLLRQWDREGDERIMSAGAVEIGAVLAEPGDMIGYSYLPRNGAEWRVAARLEDVLTAEQADELPRTRGEGMAPYEYFAGAAQWNAFVAALADEESPRHADAVRIEAGHEASEAEFRAQRDAESRAQNEG